MYDNEDEVREKRKKLYLIIGIVVFLILLIIVILLIRMGSKKKEKTTDAELSCTIAVINNVMPNSSGVYEDELEIGFTEINYDDKNGSLIKQTIGTADSSRNTDTFRITKTGNYNLHGYLQDSNGNEAICDLNVVVELSHPTCQLAVSEGVQGENGWYKSNVVVSFENINTNSDSSSIVKYYIEKSNVVIDKATQENTSKYTVVDNRETSLTGYVLDSNGGEGTCSIVVKKDSTKPTCSLKVTSGTTNASGQYTDNPVIGFVDAKDDITGIKNKGIGTSKNYTESTYTVTMEGNTTVYGYVKDEAGNEGTCKIDISKASSGGNVNPQPQPPTPVAGTPSCTLTVSGIALDKTNNLLMYEENGRKAVKITMETNNATSYGVGLTESFNGQKEYYITTPGTYVVRGYVQNANGVKAYCKTPELIVRAGDLLYTKAKFQDYVAYDAGGNRNTGQKCNANDTGFMSGWRVLSSNNQTGQVILISAGSPECVEHKTSSSTTINTIKSKANNYINKTYAVSAEALTCDSYGIDGCRVSLANRPIHLPGNYYFLATAASSSEMWAINPKGIPEKVTNTKAGVRYIVVLDRNVVTTGYSNGKWIITRY